MRTILILPLLAAVLAGCQRQATNAETGNPPQPAPPARINPDPGEQVAQANKLPPSVGGLARRMQLPEVQNYMKNLGIAYVNFETLNGRGPRNLEELAPQFENNPRMTEHLKKGWWVFIYNANRQQMTAGPSNTIIAYEAQADGNGARVVVMGDGNIRMLDEATFKKTPKAR
jgi:hypothetical protein